MSDTDPRCDHPHAHRIGGACAPCFNAHWSKLLPVGTHVTYADEPRPFPTADLVGMVIEPNAEDLAHVKTYPDPHGPDAGDVLVEWGGDRDMGSWEDPRGLEVMAEDEYRGVMLDELVRESARLGLYEATAEPRPTR